MRLVSTLVMSLARSGAHRPRSRCEASSELAKPARVQRAVARIETTTPGFTILGRLSSIEGSLSALPQRIRSRPGHASRVAADRLDCDCELRLHRCARCLLLRVGVSSAAVRNRNL